MANTSQRLVTEAALGSAMGNKAAVNHTHNQIEHSSGYKARVDPNGIFDIVDPTDALMFRFNIKTGVMDKGRLPWSSLDNVPAALDESLKDTGWRNASSILTNGWTGKVLARRVGKTVTLIFDGVDSTAATSSTISTALEVMLSPENISGLNVRFTLSTGTQTNVRGYISAASRDIRVSTYAAGSLLYGSVSFPTSRGFDKLDPYAPAA